ncbi:hypothetical protein HF209_32015 [Pseudomonas sp. WS 5096]|jgi:TPR repeat protein|uniref:Uncharacterized protein n=1 Tax=Pseudomonas cremoris TaxID=2724178 RepID=A0ABR6THX5_9PSED|nr:hypothetical protein [Pseudomonas cremoris]MBC2385583.1 hypothetical protein [Pseudomonas cremoris]
MFGFFRRKIRTVADIQELLTTEDNVKAGQVLRSEADKGNHICQIFLSQLYLDMMERETNDVILKDLTEFFVRYSKMAANQGDADTQYNLAKHLMSVASADIRAGGGRLSESGRDTLRNSKKYLLLAAEQGLDDAKESLSNLDELLDWAEAQEYV